MTTKAPRRYRVRVVGDKHDYIRRYAVIDTQTGRRVHHSICNDRDSAQDQADNLNGVDPDPDYDWDPEDDCIKEGIRPEGAS